MSSPDCIFQSMWQFPATCSLISLLCRPLHLTPPTPSLLEKALTLPRDHLELIANLHGRLLGIGAGASAAQKWLQATARFVRSHPKEFAAIGIEEHRYSADAISQENGRISKVSSDRFSEPENDDMVFIFPTELEEYIEQISSSTRLLVLHTLAETVLAEHDRLLSAGSLSELAVDDLRYKPLGTDAVGNVYWYFGDAERVYREPRENSGAQQNTPLRPDEQNKSTAFKRSKPLNPKPSHELFRQWQHSDSRDGIKNESYGSNSSPATVDQLKALASSETNSYLRVQNVRLVEDIFGPAGSSQDSVEVLESVALRPKFAGSSSGAIGSNEGREKESNTTVKRAVDNSVAIKPNTSRRRAQPAHDRVGKVDTISLNGRRKSSRIRKQPERHGSKPSSVATRLTKRPRMIEPTFTDVTLRKCGRWETLSVGSEALTRLLSRFEAEKDGILPSEKVLIQTLREVVLPEVVQQEEKVRREQMRKQKAEINFVIQKRSTRLEAISRRREEETLRIAEEKERERLRLKHIEWHEQSVKSQLAASQLEQSNDIRNTRRSHGIVNTISQDGIIQNTCDSIKSPTANGRPSKPLRRSLRTRNGMKYKEGHMPSVPGSEASERDSFMSRTLWAEEVSEIESGTGPTAKKNIELNDIKSPEAGDRKATPNSTKNELEVAYNLDIKTDALPACKSDRRVLTSACPEEDVGEEFTWDTSRADNLPTRVLDKFFFASRSTFCEVPLESTCEEKSDIVGIGILIPPTWSPACVLRVEIGQVLEWKIDYGRKPRQWIKSKHGWYELRSVATEYSSTFSSALRKFELCARTKILGDSMRAGQLSYEYVVELLGMWYMDMQRYDESEILLDKRFILKEMEKLGRKSVVQSGFFKTLTSKVKTEDRRETAKAKKDEELYERQSESARSRCLLEKRKSAENSEGHTDQQSTRTFESGKRKKLNTREEQLASKAVSSIISDLMNAATQIDRRTGEKTVDVLNTKTLPVSDGPQD